MRGVRYFFDTNVLLYLYTSGNLIKQRIAHELFQKHAELEEAVISTQVVQEFYAAGAGRVGIPEDVLRKAVSEFLELPVVTVSGAEILSAVDIKDRYGISFWDALILSAAESARAEILFTEDLNHNQRYGSVTVRNPFRDSALSPA
jgi:predicted nucleic acid-binding protein